MKLKYAFKRTITNSSASARQETEAGSAGWNAEKMQCLQGRCFCR